MEYNGGEGHDSSLAPTILNGVYRLRDGKARMSFETVLAKITTRDI